MMMRPSGHVVRTYGIPKETLREAYGSPLCRERRLAALRKPRQLCWELGVLDDALERLLEEARAVRPARLPERRQDG